MNLVISARRPDLVIVNNNNNDKKKKSKKRKEKRTFWIADFAVPGDRRVKLKKSRKRDKCLDISRELKKTLEHKSDGDTNCNWRTRYSHQRIGKETGRLGNNRTNGDYPK